MTEIKLPLEKGKWEAHSCHQSMRLIKSCWKGTVQTPVLLVVWVLQSTHLAAMAWTLWEDFYCPLSLMAASEADTEEYTSLGPPQRPHSASCRHRFIDPEVGLICHRFWQAGFLASLAIQFLYNYKNAFQAICFFSAPCVSNHSKGSGLDIDFKTKRSGLYKDLSAS